MGAFMFAIFSQESGLIKSLRKFALQVCVLGICLSIVSCAGPMDGYKKDYQKLAGNVIKAMNDAKGTHAEEWSGDLVIKCSNLLEVRETVIKYRMHLESLPVEALVEIQERPEGPWVKLMKEEIDGTLLELQARLTKLKLDIRGNSYAYPQRATGSSAMANMMYPRGFHGFFDDRLWIIAGPGDGSEVYVIDDILSMNGKDWVASATKQFEN